jgi:hypothetical protein
VSFEQCFGLNMGEHCSLVAELNPAVIVKRKSDLYVTTKGFTKAPKHSNTMFVATIRRKRTKMPIAQWYFNRFHFDKKPVLAWGKTIVSSRQ